MNNGKWLPETECAFVQEGAKGRESEGTGKNNDHNRNINSNSKTIFRNPVLCAQFLRDNCRLPVLKQVQPESIEDISERYLPYLGTEFDSDSVKRIRIFDILISMKTRRQRWKGITSCYSWCLLLITKVWWIMMYPCSCRVI